MKDIIIIIVFVCIDLLSIYCFTDTLKIFLMHRKGHGIKGVGRIIRLRRAMRTSGRPRSIPGLNNRADKIKRSREVKCDYMVDLEYTRSDGEKVTVRNLVIPSRIEVIAGGTVPKYNEGDEVPIKYGEKNRQSVVVDTPDVYEREGGVLMLCIWGLSVVFLTIFAAALIYAL